MIAICFNFGMNLVKMEGVLVQVLYVCRMWNMVTIWGISGHGTVPYNSATAGHQQPSEYQLKPCQTALLWTGRNCLYNHIIPEDCKEMYAIAKKH